MQITMKKEDIITTIGEDGITILLNLSIPELLPIYAQSMQERTVIGTAPDNYFITNKESEPIYLYNSDEDKINLIVSQETAKKLTDKSDTFSIQYGIWNKEA